MSFSSASPLGATFLCICMGLKQKPGWKTVRQPVAMTIILPISLVIEIICILGGLGRTLPPIQ